MKVAQGLVQTVIGLDLLLNRNLVDVNGIRIDVSDENNLGPFVSKEAALSAIRGILNDGASDLSGAGSFPFVLSDGFDGFDTPGTFLLYNRAIAARVSAYQGDAAGILSALGASFFSLGGDLNNGVYYTFSEDPTDIINPLFISEGGSSEAQARIVQPLFITEVEAGDTRMSKTLQLDESITLDGLTGDYIVFRYLSNSDAIPAIRNEELILLYAEANITVNPTETVVALNVIRNNAGLGDYTGPTDTASLVNEMLNQRRYSLFAEGHRWIDMRRYGKLGDLPLDRPEDDVWDKFPIPLTENQ
ncbi:MAG: hypothetical protein DRI70_05735 [Bacteroidetes bacterium]|nr:MAG: hypothetical protein DRI70_05735 [Bacteroidota bacterium]